MKEEILDDDDITDGMLLADKDIKMMNEMEKKGIPKRKQLGRTPKHFKSLQMSFTELIAEALLQADNKMLPKGDIYKAISQKYPYFKMAVEPRNGWKHSVSCTLSECKDFVRVPASANQRKGLWKLTNEAIKRICGPRSTNHMDLQRVKAEMAKRYLRVELEDIGTTIVPQLLTQKKDTSSSTSSKEHKIVPKNQCHFKTPRVSLESEELEEQARNRSRKKVKVDLNMKRRRKREQNRAAARRFRERQKSSSELIVSEEEDLCKKNKMLKERRERLEKKVKKLNKLLISSGIRLDQSHGMCCAVLRA